MLGMLALAMMVEAGCSHNNSKGDDDRPPGPYPHNVGHVHCGNHVPERYRIEVAANQQVFFKPDDTIVFLCEGDTVTWFAQDSNTLITLNFTDSYADGLLGVGHSKFGKKHETDDQIVQDQGVHRGRVYKYSITVDDGTNSFTLDPHVIPMGK